MVRMSIAKRAALIALLALPALVAGAATRSAATDATVACYHGSPARTGDFVVPGLDWRSAATVRRDRRFDGRVDGRVDAQPLYWRPAGTARGLVVVATENDVVAALDSVTGKPVWQRALGKPVARSALPCGNIDPLGIAGTPVIDPARGAIYLDAMVDAGGTPRHRVYALRLADGSVLPGFPVDVAAALAARGVAFDPAVQNQRGALALIDGRVVVPFGGHWGDCGHYHGTLVALGIDPPRVTAVWTTRAAKGGIWAPAGPSEADGRLYFATGNTAGTVRWGDGNAVFRVGPDLARAGGPRDFFAPADWRQLDAEDLDLGGVTPLPIALPAGPPLLLALGKDGNAYLLDRADLGGFGRALAVLPAARGAIIGAAAAYRGPGAAFVVYQASAAACPDGSHLAGLGAIAITPGNKLRSAWCARLDGRGAPIVTTTDGRSQPIVWAVGAEGDDRLHGFRGDTGAEILSGDAGADAMHGLRHFATILVADDRFYVAGDGRVYAFELPR